MSAMAARRTMVSRAFCAATLLFASLLELAGQGASPVQPALRGNFDKPVPRTREEIAAAWDILSNIPPGYPYEQEPRLSAPFAPGRLTRDYLERALAVLNFYRYVAGCPEDLEIEEDWNEESQHAAVLLAFEGISSHYPPYPEGSGMAKAFYDLACRGAATSNLMGGGFEPIAEEGENGLERTLHNLIYDSDPWNSDRVGHRKSLLNPEARLAGFGYADSCAAIQVRSAGGALDDSGRRFGYMAWPPAGTMPIFAFDPSEMWSIFLYPAGFPGRSLGVKDQVTVTLTRARDGKTWRFGKGSPKEDFNVVSDQASSEALTVVFRPAGLTAYQEDDLFSVRIDGVVDGKGAPVPIQYSTSFYSIEPQLASAVESRHPSVNTIWGSFTTTTKGLGTTAFEKTGITASFGYYNHPLRSFTLVIDTPDGIVPVGVELNGSGRVFAPGEDAAPDQGPIRSIRLQSTVPVLQLSYYINSQAKGHSRRFDEGEVARFDDDSPIETVTILVK